MALTGRLAGVAAVVTGAGSGIGREIARLFASEGAAVACVDKARDAAEETARSIDPSGATAHAFRADVSSPADVARACVAIADHFGAVQVLVNNAGGGGAGSVAAVDDAAWRETIDVNLSGAFYMSRAFWPAFVNRGSGVIVNNGSIMGLRGDMNSVAYCTAKAAIVGLTRSLAADGAGHGIRVNCVCPGFVDTPAMRAVAQSAVAGRTFEDFARAIPLGRMASVREVALAFLYLASDESSYVTGTTLVVDGGATLGYQGSDVSTSRGSAAP